MQAGKSAREKEWWLYECLMMVFLEVLLFPFEFSFSFFLSTSAMIFPLSLLEHSHMSQWCGKGTWKWCLVCPQEKGDNVKMNTFVMAIIMLQKENVWGWSLQIKQMVFTTAFCFPSKLRLSWPTILKFNWCQDWDTIIMTLHSLSTSNTFVSFLVYFLTFC